MNYNKAYAVATAPTSNDHYFKNIILDEAAKKDNSWCPYIYRPFYCPTCDQSTGFQRKIWLGLFHTSDLFIYCMKCSQNN